MGAVFWPATFHKEPLLIHLTFLIHSESVFRPEDLIYLSPDGETTLESIASSKTYVIGGFVDRSVNKVVLDSPLH